MIAFRNENPVLQTGSCSEPVWEQGVIRYERVLEENCGHTQKREAGKRMVVLLNFSDEDKELGSWGLSGEKPAFDTSGKYGDRLLAAYSGAVFMV